MLDTIAMAEMLKGEYRKVFEKADMYSTLSSEGTEVDDERIMNLYDMLLEAQTNEKPVEKIVGTDIEAFCKAYFQVDKEEQEKWYIKLPTAIYSVLKWVLIATLLCVIFPEEGTNLQTMVIDIFPFISGFVVGLIFLVLAEFVFKKIIFKRKIKPIVLYSLLLLIFLGGMFWSIWLDSGFSVKVPVIWLWTVAVGYEAIYLLIRSIWRYRTYGTIRKDTKEERERKKEEKEIKKLFNQEVSMESSNDLIVKSMAKRYDRLNKRNLKRKQEELAFSEYAKKIRKEEHLGNILTPVIFLVLVIGCIIAQIISSGLVDGLLYGLILIVIEGFVYRFVKKLNDEGTKQRLHILEECKIRGISIREYADEVAKQKY